MIRSPLRYLLGSPRPPCKFAAGTCGTSHPQYAQRGGQEFACEIWQPMPVGLQPPANMLGPQCRSSPGLAGWSFEPPLSPHGCWKIVLGVAATLPRAATELSLPLVSLFARTLHESIYQWDPPETWWGCLTGQWYIDVIRPGGHQVQPGRWALSG